MARPHRPEPSASLDCPATADKRRLARLAVLRHDAGASCETETQPGRPTVRGLLFQGAPTRTAPNKSSRLYATPIAISASLTNLLRFLPRRGQAARSVTGAPRRLLARTNGIKFLPTATAPPPTFGGSLPREGWRPGGLPCKIETGGVNVLCWNVPPACWQRDSFGTPCRHPA